MILLTLMVIGIFAYPVIYQAIPSSITRALPLPSSTVVVFMLIFGIMAIGLNIVIGFAGLLDLGYVAFYAIGAYTAAFLASPHFGGVSIVLFSDLPAGFPGIHLPFGVILVLGGGGRGDLRRAARCADAAPARRLPRDRHARVRRDRPDLLQEPGERELQLVLHPARERQPHRRPARHQPDRCTELLRDQVRGHQRLVAGLPRAVPASSSPSSSRGTWSARAWAAPGWRSARTRSPPR